MALVDHYTASKLVKTWRAREVANVFAVALEDLTHVATLVYPGEGYTVRVTFSTIKGHPDWVRVRSTNWRCEDEPNGVFAADECRQFYKRLRAAGFLQLEN